jgi:DNA-binding response OmpR family regulator
MQVLIADDQPITLTQLTGFLQKWGYDPVAVDNGDAAWEVLQREDSPPLALMDCQMPGKQGEDVCRLVRSRLPNKPLHIILMTATLLNVDQKVNGLGAGADDYLTNPFEPAELLARLRVGERLIALQTELRGRVAELETALAEVKQLQGLLPICMDCKSIRDDRNYWHQLEHYIAAHSGAAFTHSLCPRCFKQRVAGFEPDPMFTEREL